MFAAERCFSERNLHLQGIARLHLRTEKQQGAAQMCQKEIIKALGWDSKSKPKNARVMVRFLRHEGLHTWIGMVGYCIKNETADDYTEISGCVTEEDKRLGRQLYLQLGAGDLKNKTALCPRNLFNKVNIQLIIRVPSPVVCVSSDCVSSDMFLPHPCRLHITSSKKSTLLCSTQTASFLPCYTTCCVQKCTIPQPNFWVIQVNLTAQHNMLTH